MTRETDKGRPSRVEDTETTPLPQDADSRRDRSRPFWTPRDKCNTDGPGQGRGLVVAVTPVTRAQPGLLVLEVLLSRLVECPGTSVHGRRELTLSPLPSRDTHLPSFTYYRPYRPVGLSVEYRRSSEGRRDTHTHTHDLIAVCLEERVRRVDGSFRRSFDCLGRIQNKIVF